ncbi:monovalent cation/H+ antiporter complex subunit F [Macrococcoides caseolyticum]|uniref:monovalent cation/H+ antiporter complex subunit F n=1 Tax=Macrococcoides caseolyticum TaxID=69966 RepID=UPI001F15F9B0|nr:monovalent cation/H+ antiporter complex subunit F [Macrococcus caseolyticus]MCE4956522.1 Na(+)/H(+) antiporter subunit F [Macrococcus caseolyticus]
MSMILIKSALVIYGLAIMIVMYRVIAGPSLPDRIVAFDSISAMIMSSVSIICLIMDTTLFLEAILIIGVLSFISTIATSRFIERGVIFERKR